MSNKVETEWEWADALWKQETSSHIKPLDPQTSKKTPPWMACWGQFVAMQNLSGWNQFSWEAQLCGPKSWWQHPNPPQLKRMGRAWDWPRAPKILCVARPTWARTSPQRSGYIGATWFCGFACRSRSRVTWCRANKLNKYNFGSQILLLWWPCQKMNAYQHTLAFCSCSLNLSVVLCPTSPNRPSCNIHSQMIVTIWIFGSYPLVI